MESFFLGDEIFRRQTYKEALKKAGDVHTVVDLGCNVGYFCCYLRDFFGRSDLRGFGVDANPNLLKNAQRNLKLNGLVNIQLVNGLVGAAEDAASQDFYIYASHLGSSQFLQPEAGRPLKGDWKKISVPIVRVSDLWKQQFGEEMIDLLKIDIEGSEGKLLRFDPELLRRAKCVVLEWHKWLVDEAELFPVLKELGFTVSEALETGPTAELWFFARR